MRQKAAEAVVGPRTRRPSGRRCAEGRRGQERLEAFRWELTSMYVKCTIVVEFHFAQDMKSHVTCNAQAKFSYESLPIGMPRIP